MPDNDKSAAYVAWTTFKNAVDGFAQSLPNRVDRSVFPGLSGGVQYQLIAALKWLGLTDDDNRPTALLKRMAALDEDGRKQELDALFRSRYSTLFELDLPKTTPAELAERMTAASGLTGTTRDKALRFFLAALEYLGIPVSPLLAKKKTNGGGGSGRRRPSRKAAKVVAPTVVSQVVPASGTSKSIRLSRGETVTLSATADFFAMDPADRDFLFEIVKKLEQYEQGLGSKVLSGQSQTDEGGEE